MHPSVDSIHKNGEEKGRKRGQAPFFKKKNSPKKSGLLFMISKKHTFLVMILKAKLYLRAQHCNLKLLSLRACVAIS
jgi:hypothetical protein